MLLISGSSTSVGLIITPGKMIFSELVSIYLIKTENSINIDFYPPENCPELLSSIV